MSEVLLLDNLAGSIKFLARNWFVDHNGKKTISNRTFTALFSFDIEFHTCLWLKVRETFNEQSLSLRDYLATFRCLTDPPKNKEGWAIFFNCDKSTVLTKFEFCLLIVDCMVTNNVSQSGQSILLYETLLWRLGYLGKSV